MFYLYVIQGNKYKRYYIGISQDVKERLREHNSGLVKSTKAYHPYQLLYIESYPTKKLARQRELELKKHGQKKRLLLQKIKNHGFQPLADQP